MKLHELEGALKDGRRIRRSSWPDQMCVYVSETESPVFRLIRKLAAGATDPYSAGLGDLFADDWEIVTNAREEAYMAWNVNCERSITTRDVWNAAWDACKRSVDR